MKKRKMVDNKLTGYNGKVYEMKHNTKEGKPFEEIDCDYGEPTYEEINKILEAANAKVLEEMKRTEEIIRQKFKEIYG